MAIPKFNVDMDIISKLGDYPGADDGLTPAQFREKFDLGGKLIQEYINTQLVPNINMTTDVDSLIEGVQEKLTDVININQAVYFDNVLMTGDCVIDSGFKFAITKSSNTSFELYGGKALIQGHYVPVEPESTIKVTIPAGAAGTYRNDLVCLRLERNSTGELSFGIIHLQGTTSQNSASDPSYRQDNINASNSTVRDLPLYRIRINGTTATSEQLFGLFGGMTTKTTEAVSLPVSGWNNNTQTVTVPGVTRDNDVLVTAAPSSYDAYAEYMVRCTGQGNNSLTFACSETPKSSITANVIIFN